MNSDGKETEFELLNYPPETDQLLPNEIIYAHVSAENNLLSSFRSPPLSKDQLETLQDKSGRIADEHLFRKCIFRGFANFFAFVLYEIIVLFILLRNCFKNSISFVPNHY